MAQHLVFANCIPLILKFFNQNIMSYITAKNGYFQGLFELQKSQLHDKYMLLKGYFKSLFLFSLSLIVFQLLTFPIVWCMSSRN